MNRKGFTLIELLAVVIILGIIMMIAIPAVSNIIHDTRKSTYVDTALSYIDAVEKAVTARKLKILEDGSANYIPVDIIKLDKSGVKSPFGEWRKINQNIRYAAFDDDEVTKCTGVSANVKTSTTGFKMYNPETGVNDTYKTYHKVSQGCIPKGTLHDAWVVVRYDTIKEKYIFYWTSRDVTNHGVKLTERSELKASSVQSSFTNPTVTFISSTRVAKPDNYTFYVDELSGRTGISGVRANLVLYNKVIYGGRSTGE